jgi:hypothetical protein
VLVAHWLRCRPKCRYDSGRSPFTQPDPIGLAGGLNLYGYAAGDPINFSDPFGLSPTCLAGALGSVALGFGLSVATGGDYSARSALVDAGLGCVGAGLGSKLASLRRARALAATDDAASVARQADPNKLNHIFGQAKHNLDDFVGKFGSQDEAFFAIQDATQAAFNAGDVATGARGVFRQTVRVAGQDLTVEGRVIDGVVRVGTAYK